jgi:hypothetical protein
MKENRATCSEYRDLVSLGDEQKVLEVLEASVLNLWETVNNLGQTVL